MYNIIHVHIYISYVACCRMMYVKMSYNIAAVTVRRTYNNNNIKARPSRPESTGCHRSEEIYGPAARK